MASIETSMPAAQSLEPSKRPSYQLLAQNEDWSFLADTEQRTGLFDSLKYVPISDDGSLWLSFGGELRMRFEGWKGFNFGAPANVSHNDSFLLTRGRVHADLHWGENLRAFFELKSAQATDRDLPGGRRPLDLDTFDIQQLFVDHTSELGNESSLTLRVGRQMLSFGAQRLISPLPWGNTLRTWDGVSVAYDRGPLSIRGIATAFVPVDKTDTNHRNADELLYGVYARQTYREKNAMELYWLVSERPNLSFNGTSGDTTRHTLGVRRLAPLGEGVDGEVELSYQFGEVGVEDVSAWSFASQVGYRPSAGSTRYWLGLDWASGDDKPGGDVQTFDPLYPLGHAYFGYLDAVGRQNAVDGSLGATCQWSEDLTLALGGHSFWLASKDDALYNAGGGVSRASGAFESNMVGWELNATATWRHGPHVATQFGVGHFFAGDALEESGSSEDVDFAFVSAAFTF